MSKTLDNVMETYGHTLSIRSSASALEKQKKLGSQLKTNLPKQQRDIDYDSKISTDKTIKHVTLTSIAHAHTFNSSSSIFENARLTSMAPILPNGNQLPSNYVPKVNHSKVEAIMEIIDIKVESLELALELITSTKKVAIEGAKMVRVVTEEFLKMFDAKANNKQLKYGMLFENYKNQDKKTQFLDLGNGLGSIIQTRDRGFMASINRFNDKMTRKKITKLALQISKSFVLRDPRLSSGLEAFWRLDVVDLEDMCSKLTLLASTDELMGKTTEKIAFEDTTYDIVSGRNKDGASSFAAKSIGAAKRMTSTMSEDMKRRSLNENWSIREDSISLEDDESLILLSHVSTDRGQYFVHVYMNVGVFDEGASKSLHLIDVLYLSFPSKPRWY